MGCEQGGHSARHQAGSARVEGVEGLRAVATLAVVAYHVWLYAAPSGKPSFGALDLVLWNLQAGVTLFFALSGYLLYRPFARAILQAEARPRISAYAVNRVLRILPAYWVVLLTVAFVLNAARLSIVTLEIGSLAGSPGTLLANLILIQNYHPATVLTGVGPAWSLAVEAVFYLVLPLLAVAAWRFAGGEDPMRPRSTRICAALLPAAALLLLGITGKTMAAALASSGLLSGKPWDGSWYSVLALGFWYHADLFTWGMLTAVVHVEVESGRFTLPANWTRRVAALIFMISLAIGALAVVRFVGAKQAFEALMGIVCGLVLCLIVLPWRHGAGRDKASPLAQALEWRPLAAIGTISYSLFLWNEPVALWLHEHSFTWDGRAGLLFNLVLVLAVALAASAVTYRWVELPTLGLKRYRTNQTTTFAEVPERRRSIFPANSIAATPVEETIGKTG